MSPPDPPARRTPDALQRMRRYTTITFGVTIAVIVAVPLLRPPSTPWLFAIGIAAAVCAVAVGIHWEGPVPRWLATVAVIVTMGAWTGAVATRELPALVLSAAVVVAVLATHVRTRRTVAAIAGGALILSPVAIAALISQDAAWGGWIVTALASYGFLWVLLRFNDYGWGPFLQLDAAREAARNLAIVQERYRMAADLHDIQGHALHVIRLTMQVARRTIPTDPTAAIEQLTTAEALVLQTVAQTRDLVSGDRIVTVASELANAKALFEAAGITCSVDGEATSDADELLALLLRESTTNILRHAQAEQVRIELDRTGIRIANDGAPGAMRPAGGLARLAERFKAKGGGLEATTDRGWFRVEGRLA